MKVRYANRAGAEWIGIVDGNLLVTMTEDHEHSRRTVRRLCKSSDEAAERLASFLEGAAQESAVKVDLTKELEEWKVNDPLTSGWPKSAYRLFVRANGIASSLIEDASAFTIDVCKAAGIPHHVVCSHNDGMGARVTFGDGAFGGVTFGFAPAEERRALRPVAVEQLMLFGNGYGNDLLMGPDGNGYGFVVLPTGGALFDLPVRIFLSRIQAVSRAISVSCLFGLEYCGGKVTEPQLMGFDWWSHRTDVDNHLAGIGFVLGVDPASLLGERLF